MKRAKALSRCEVDGKVYLPGDDMTVTDIQLTYLKQHNAAVEIILQGAMPAPAPGATIEAHIAQLNERAARPSLGFGKPKKEK